jgi:hypothetical protein
MTLQDVKLVVGEQEFEEILVSFACTCSSKVIRMTAEIALRKLYPSDKYGVDK